VPDAQDVELLAASVREAGDLSAGVFDLEGRMLAQAVTGTPGHVNSMPAAVGSPAAMCARTRAMSAGVNQRRG